MNRGRILVGVCLVFVMIGALLSGACAKPAAPAKPATHAPAEVSILTTKMGSNGYIMMMGLAELINKNSTWLRASGTEGAGANANIAEVALNPQAKKNSLIYGGAWSYWGARQGNAPFTSKQPIVSVIFASGANGAFITANPNIKTKDDLIGKKIAVGGKGQLEGEQAAMILRDMWGIIDKVNLQYVGMADGVTALGDGLVDAAYAFINFAPPPAYFGTDFPASQAFWASKDNAHYIGPTAQEVKRAADITGWPLAQAEVPAGALGAKQSKPVGALVSATLLMAFPELEDDIATEVLRVIYKTYPEFKGIMNNMAVITPATMGWLPSYTEGDVHPASIKFFKENGITLYVGGAGPVLK